MNLLLDTHVFIWLVSQLRRIPEPIQDMLTAADNIVFLSVVSSWEIQVKMQLGKLTLPVPRKHLIDQSMHSGFKLLPVNPPHIDALDQLALHHRDPFDRMLLAQAKAEGLQLVSANQKIQHYRDQVEIFWPV